LLNKKTFLIKGFFIFSEITRNTQKISKVRRFNVRARNSRITINHLKSMSNKNVSLDDPDYVFTTYDLGCSTALLCAGFELLDIKKSNPKKALFTFKRESNIDEVANNYFANKLNVKARSFADNLKALKNKLYGN
jgi:hypothetical protein